MTIRTATIKDLKTLSRISEQTFREAFENNNSSQDNFEAYAKTAFTEIQLQSEIEVPGNLFVLAENELGEAIGYGKLRTDNRRKDLLNGLESIEVERIYSLKKYWGKGLGKALMLKMLELAREQGYKHICLSVYEENPRAIRFYEKLGFKSVGIVEFKLADVVENDVLMVKRSSDIPV